MTENYQEISSSVYRKIAIDIAQNISNGKYLEGQKLFGRSTLAAHYNVSPETIRKAVHLLKDVGVLTSEKGSGIEVISKDKAIEFVQNYKESLKIVKVKTELVNWANNQIEESKNLIKKINLLVDSTERFKALNFFTPFEIKIDSNSKVIGKTISELNFWHNTGATVIAIERNNKIILSPGPYATFLEGDTFYIIGTEQAFYACKKIICDSIIEN